MGVSQVSVYLPTIATQIGRKDASFSRFNTQVGSWCVTPPSCWWATYWVSVKASKGVASLHGSTCPGMRVIAECAGCNDNIGFTRTVHIKAYIVKLSPSYSDTGELKRYIIGIMECEESI